MPELQITRFTKTSGAGPDGFVVARHLPVGFNDPLLTKVLVPDGRGGFEKDGKACAMTTGRAERLCLRLDRDRTGATLREVDHVLQRLGQDQAIGLGVVSHPEAANPVQIVTKVVEQPPRSLARTKANFAFRSGEPALLLLDIDTKWISPPMRAVVEGAGGLLEAILAVVPTLSRCARLVRKSTSAGIIDADGRVVGDSKNLHVYFVAADGTDIPRALEVLHRRLCLAGLGAVVTSDNGSLLVRSLVDIAVGSPERLVFEAEPLVVAPLRRDPAARCGAITDGEVLDTRSALPDLTAEQKAAFDAWHRAGCNAIRPEVEKRRRVHREKTEQRLVDRGVPRAAARRAAEARLTRKLLGSDTVQLDDGREVTVGELLTNRAAFDEVTCRDPFEPDEGLNKAIIYTHPHELGRPVAIYSLLHGGQSYSLRHDAASLCSLIEGAGFDAQAQLLDGLQHAEIEPHEQEALIAAAAQEANPAASKAELARVSSALRKSIKARSKSARDVFDDGADLGDPPGEDGIPRGFVCAARGWVRAHDGDTAGATPFCGPFEVIGRVSEESGTGWGTLIQWSDPAGRQQDYIVAGRAVAADLNAVLAELADRGLWVDPDPRAKQHLARLLAGLCPPTHRTAVRSTGWAGDSCAFVLPGGEVLGGDADGVVLIGDRGHRLASAGTLEAWQKGVAALARENSRAVLALCSALSSPLLQPLGADGVIFHLVGPSSCGKTTLGKTHASVWGSPSGDGSISGSWRLTDNGAEGLLAKRSGVALGLDEIGQAPPASLGALAYMISNGAGKARANRHGEARQPKTWRVDVFSTGESGLQAAMSRAGDRPAAGMQARFIDIPAVPTRAGARGVFEWLHGYPDGKTFADALADASRVNHGHAGPAFVAWLAKQRAETRGWDFVANAVRTAFGAFEEVVLPDCAAAQAHRVAWAFARLAAAGELAIEARLLPWSAGEALSGVGHCFSAWLAERGGGGADREAPAAVERVRAFLETNVARFQAIGQDEPRPEHEDADTPPPWASSWPRVPLKRAGFREVGTNDFLILPSVWADEIHAGHDPRAAARALRAAGLLQGDRGDRLTCRRLIRGEARIDCYRVRAGVLEGAP